MLLWLQTIPRNKNKQNNVVPKRFSMFACESAATPPLARCEGGRRRGEEIHLRWRLFTETTMSHPFSITSMISFYTKKWHHFHSNEVQSRTAQRCHLPIDYYANSYTVHRCNKRNRDGQEKTVIRGSRVVTTAEEWLWVSFRVKPLWECSAKWDPPPPYGRLWAAQWQQHLLSQPVFTPSIFRANGPSQSWSLTCNSPLM